MIAGQIQIPSFYISTTAGLEVYSKLEIGNLANLLEKNIDLRQYGSGVKHFAFTLIADDPTDEQLHNFASYDPESKEVNIGLSYLPFNELQKAPIEWINQRLVDFFLLAIDVLISMEIPDFDAEKLKEDIFELFQKNDFSN